MGNGYKKLTADEDYSSKFERRKLWKARAKRIAKSVKHSIVKVTLQSLLGVSYCQWPDPTPYAHVHIWSPGYY